MAAIAYSNNYCDKRLQINFEKRLVLLDSHVVSLTRKEYELLSTLAAEAGRTFSHPALLDRVFGYKSGTHTRTLDVHICRVRKKLGSTGRRYIETIFGVGTRFQRWSERVDTEGDPGT